MYHLTWEFQFITFNCTKPTCKLSHAFLWMILPNTWLLTSLHTAQKVKALFSEKQQHPISKTKWNSCLVIALYVVRSGSIHLCEYLRLSSKNLIDILSEWWRQKYAKLSTYRELSSDTKNLIDYQKESTKRINECNEWNVLLDVYDTNIWWILWTLFTIKYELLGGEMSYKIRGRMVVSRHTVRM